VEVWQISNLWPLRLGEEKRKIMKEGKKKSQGKNTMAAIIIETLIT